MTHVNSFWGKARSELAASAASSHPAAYHMLDVAACAQALLPYLAPQIGLSWRSLAVFLIALHDVGKFTRTFQALSPAHWPVDALGAYAGRVPAERHDTLGFRVLQERLSDEVTAALPGWRQSAIDPLLRAVAGHHGQPPLENATSQLSKTVFCLACREASRAVLREMQALLLPEPPPPLEPAAARRLSWALAGLATAADWIGSAQCHFPYTAPLPGGLAAYWALTQPRAAKAVADAGVLPATASFRSGLRDLFPGIEEASPVQGWAGTADLPPGPVLALIEDVTGSGKTEAAVLLAHRLMAAGRADGLFFALPTMATADAMFARLGVAYRRLFAPEARPSLVLAHGRRALHAGFHDMVLRGLHPQGGEAGENPAGAACAAWIAADRRLAFLADVGAGTVDQAFLAALPSRHAALRLLGLARKVLVVDEAHAYDSYMRGELAALLQFQAALGGSAVVLSATLPHAQRATLAEAFASGLKATKPVLHSAAYPLATLVSAEGACETECEARPESRRSVAVTRLPDVEAALDAIMEAAAAGAAVAWVRNTVDDAIAAAAALRARGVGPTLFHARYAMGDRQRIQENVLRWFGKESVASERARVLVATQVVEQSLDLDFDLLVSDLAPVDLLIQRAGRLWRHPGRMGRSLRERRLLVLSPAPAPEPPADWIHAVLPGTASVYRDPALLWRGARGLFAAGEIATPDGVRPLVEAAYDPDGEVPNAFRPATEKAQGRDQAHGNLAGFNVLKVADGYKHGSGAWNSDTITPTRIGDETTTFRLARLADGEVVPWSSGLDPQHAWALSEVSVRKTRAVTAQAPSGAEAAVERAKAAWPEWDRTLPILVLTEASDGSFRGVLLDEAGREVAVCYAADGAGLVLPAREGGMTR